jgi:hypothetical protein
MTPEQITHITRAYAFSADDKTALAEVLASAYLHAKLQAYSRAHATAGKHVTLALWKPGSEDQGKAHKWAEPIADGIAETYECLLKSQLENMEESGDTQDGIEEGLGDLWQGVKGVVQKIGDWFSGLMGWKPDQIADTTWSEGDNDGTEQFVGDVVSSGTDYSKMRVRVEPDTSSSDYCKDYAGKSYSFESVGSDVPEFPTHSNCVHHLVVYVVNEQGDEEVVDL